ncbi:MAG: hypothetical protein IJD39_00600 [Clostridia bacterium]|nr:hypothetical protein [Clostridia bacterium]
MTDFALTIPWKKTIIGKVRLWGGLHGPAREGTKETGIASVAALLPQGFFSADIDAKALI